MSKLKILIITTFILSLLMLIGSVSAADLTVNSNTSHKDITDWMNSGTTVSGNNLIFNVSSYELSDTLLVSKSINIKSDKKTQINFKQNKNMFNISANQISFSGLVLNHNGKGVYGAPVSTILAPIPAKTITIRDTTINLRNDYSIAISMGSGKCNFINSQIIGNGMYNYGVVALDLNVNFQNSQIRFNKNFGSGILTYNKLTGDFTNTKISLQSESLGISSPEWVGNFINSEITGNSDSWGIYVDKWNGKLSSSKIVFSGVRSYGVHSKNGLGTISKSTIHAKNGVAVYASKNVKASASSVISRKNFPGLYYIGPRVVPLRVSSTTRTNTYTFRISNIGESKSKVSQLRISVGKFKKTAKVKEISKGNIITVKVKLPSKYATTKTKKTANIIFYNSAGKKEVSPSLVFRF